jgi:hypothetical protein
MLSQDMHVRVLMAERHSEAREAARRARALAARRSKRPGVSGRDPARWLRRLLVAVR